MEDPIPVVLTSPQKRPHVDDVEPSVSTPTRSAPSTASTPLTVVSSLDTPSPLKFKKPDAAAPPGSAQADTLGSAQPSTSTPQPAKRRKLTPQEKEEQAKEKEAKAQAQAQARAEKQAQKEAEEKSKAEQKAQREEEKRARDEEKRKKNEEKEEKKRAKELKQQQDEEEKRKKERSQMRLNAFFVKPKTTAEPTGDTLVEPIQQLSTGQTSLSTDSLVTPANPVSPSPQKALVKNAQSDYDRVFLPFSLPPTAILAPSNALLSTAEILAAQSRLDGIVSHKDFDMAMESCNPVHSIFPKRRRRGLETKTVVEIVDRVNGSADNTIHLTDRSSAKPLDLLKQIPMKYLHFTEDVRPPYFGTYTKIHNPHQERKVARNPTCRGLDDLNYDYDSEAEWEEPGEGEDLDSEGEEDLDDGDEEDLDGFLDDEDDPDMKRRMLNGDQEPVSTGLCWEDMNGVSLLNDGSGAISTEFKDYKMGFLLQTQQPIDPFSDAYWIPEHSASRSALQTMIKGEPQAGAMNPPRLPLTTRPVNGLLNTLNGSHKPPSGIDAKTGKSKRTIPPELLPEFKAVVEGSDLTKIGMIEALKKKFPKVPKDALTHTLNEVAQRIGPSAAEKRWVLLN